MSAELAIALSCACVGFAAGVFVGLRAKDRYWRTRADGPQRACALNGQLFHVVLDGDVVRADEVRKLCEP